MKYIAPVLVLFTAFSAAVALAAPAAADVQSVQADLNGDGVLDQVTARQAPDNEHEQVLTALVGNVGHVARVPLNVSPAGGAQPLRAVDVNADGRDEVVVTESLGANTYGFSVWGMAGGWQPLYLNQAGGGGKLRLWEGGGHSAVSGYGCEYVGGERQLFTVAAELVDPVTETYAGTRINHTVLYGTAVEVSRQAVVGSRPALKPNPLSCA